MSRDELNAALILPMTQDKPGGSKDHDLANALQIPEGREADIARIRAKVAEIERHPWSRDR